MLLLQIYSHPHQLQSPPPLLILDLYIFLVMAAVGRPAITQTMCIYLHFDGSGCLGFFFFFFLFFCCCCCSHPAVQNRWTVFFFFFFFFFFLLSLTAAARWPSHQSQDSSPSPPRPILSFYFFIFFFFPSFSQLLLRTVYSFILTLICVLSSCQ